MQFLKSMLKNTTSMYSNKIHVLFILFITGSGYISDNLYKGKFCKTCVGSLSFKVLGKYNVNYSLFLILQYVIYINIIYFIDKLVVNTSIPLLSEYQPSPLYTSKISLKYFSYFGAILSSVKFNPHLRQSFGCILPIFFIAST